ncbi:type II toxin-antitoxin system RelE/ParE family toxin [Bradyrhizobium sp. HKCCYLS20291]|uniref:type II toxin-antitoxin system RelE/ParE family toxin n=1 Tax=Bradyrhizobium sp. HKCCYLS20291 TaxID=3420766 RepID=UPI003EB894C0
MSAGERSALWSPDAVGDLERLWDYLAAAAGPATADRVLRDVQSVVLTLAEFPHAGRSRDELRPGLRSIPVGAQVVFYRVVNDRPQIVRIIDGRQDIAAVFTDEKPSN